MEVQWSPRLVRVGGLRWRVCAGARRSFVDSGPGEVRVWGGRAEVVRRLRPGGGVCSAGVRRSFVDSGPEEVCEVAMRRVGTVSRRLRTCGVPVEGRDQYDRRQTVTMTADRTVTATVTVD